MSWPKCISRIQFIIQSRKADNQYAKNISTQGDPPRACALLYRVSYSITGIYYLLRKQTRRQLKDTVQLFLPWFVAAPIVSVCFKI